MLPGARRTMSNGSWALIPVITRVAVRKWVDHTLIKLPSKLHWLMSQKLEIILVMERSVKHDSSRSHWLRGTTKERQVWAGKRLSLFVKFSFNWRYREERNIIKCCKDKSYKLLFSSIQNFHWEIKLQIISNFVCWIFSSSITLRDFPLK